MSEHALTPFENPKQYPIPFDSKEEMEQKTLNEVLSKVQLPKESDPWGDNIPGMVLFVVGDSHIPRAEPKDETTLLLQPYKTVSRLDPRNPKRYAEDRQRRFVDTWVAEVYAIKQQLEASREVLKSGYIPVVVHVGDRGADAELKGDMQNALWTVGEGLTSLSEEDPRLKTVLLPGDHEFDRQRHGDQVSKEEMRLLGGKPAFFQRVGTKHLLVGLTTSLAEDTDDEQQSGWKKSQEALIREATATALMEGRKIILLGHKESVLQRIAEENQMPVELIQAIFSGHRHIGNLKENKSGTILGTVGAPTVGAFGLEVNITPSFIRADIDDKAGLQTTLVKVNPDNIKGLLYDD